MLNVAIKEKLEADLASSFMDRDDIANDLATERERHDKTKQVFKDLKTAHDKAVGRLETTFVNQQDMVNRCRMLEALCEQVQIVLQEKDARIRSQEALIDSLRSMTIASALSSCSGVLEKPNHTDAMIPQFATPERAEKRTGLKHKQNLPEVVTELFKCSALAEDISERIESRSIHIQALQAATEGQYSRIHDRVENKLRISIDHAIATQKQVQAREEENCKFSKEIIELKSQIQASEQASEMLRVSESESSSRCTVMQEELRALKALLTKNEVEVKTTKTRAAMSESKVSVISEQLTTLQHTLALSEKKRTELQQELSSQQSNSARLQSVEESGKNAAREIVRLQDEVERLSQCICDAEENESNAIKSYTCEKGKVGVLKQQVTHLKKKNNLLLDKKSILDQTIVNLRSHVKQLQEYKETARKKLLQVKRDSDINTDFFNLPMPSFPGRRSGRTTASQFEPAAMSDTILEGRQSVQHRHPNLKRRKITEPDGSRIGKRFCMEPDVGEQIDEVLANHSSVASHDTRLPQQDASSHALEESELSTEPRMQDLEEDRPESNGKIASILEASQQRQATSMSSSLKQAQTQPTTEKIPSKPQSLGVNKAHEKWGEVVLAAPIGRIGRSECTMLQPEAQTLGTATTCETRQTSGAHAPIFEGRQSSVPVKGVSMTVDFEQPTCMTEKAEPAQNLSVSTTFAPGAIKTEVATPQHTVHDGSTSAQTQPPAGRDLEGEHTQEEARLNSADGDMCNESAATKLHCFSETQAMSDSAASVLNVFEQGSPVAANSKRLDGFLEDQALTISTASVLSQFKLDAPAAASSAIWSTSQDTGTDNQKHAGDDDIAESSIGESNVPTARTTTAVQRKEPDTSPDFNFIDFFGE